MFEWNDAAVFIASRGLRGGVWDTTLFDLPASFRNSDDPTTENLIVGFRVASVPEPSALLLTLIAASVSLTRRRRSSL